MSRSSGNVDCFIIAKTFYWKADFCLEAVKACIVIIFISHVIDILTSSCWYLLAVCTVNKSVLVHTTVAYGEWRFCFLYSKLWHQMEVSGHWVGDPLGPRAGCFEEEKNFLLLLTIEPTFLSSPQPGHYSVFTECSTTKIISVTIRTQY